MHSGPNVKQCIKLTGFLPQERRLIRFTGQASKQGETADGIGHVERLGILLFPVNFQRFLVQRSRKFKRTLFTEDVRQVPDSMS